MIFFVSIPVQKSYAIGPILKVVGGEALDQVMQGIAYKAGQSFVDESALDKARGRWNLEGYQKAQDYDNKLSAEEKARWDNFNNEVKNAKIEPIPGKPGYGKILLKGAAFLTGVDLIYNGIQAFNAGLSSGQPVDIATYTETMTPQTHPGVTLSTSTIEVNGVPTVFGTLTVRLDDGTFVTKSKLDLGYAAGIPGSSAPFHYEVSGNVVVIKGANGAVPNGHIYTFPSISPALDIPMVAPVPVTARDLIYNTPSGFKGLGTVPGTGLPNIQEIPEIHPDSVVEIVVPLEVPGGMPYDIPPLTPEEYEELITTIPGKPPVDPEKPPVVPDKPPGINPGDIPDLPPGIIPDIKPGEEPLPPDEALQPSQGGFWNTLWEWLKKIYQAIIAIPGAILGALYKLILFLAIPSDGFFTNKFNELKMFIEDETQVKDLIDDFKGLGGGSGGSFKDVTVSLMGVGGLEVIDADSINSVLDKIHSWVRGVFFPFLLLYNINQIYKLIRGTSLLEVTRGMARREKEGG